MGDKLSNLPAELSVEFRFAPLTQADLPLLHNWLARPHMAEWWDEPGSLEDLAADYAPVMAGSLAQRCYIVYQGVAAIGFIQAYTPVDFHHEGWWLNEHDPGVRGIDQFLAEASQLGQGLGTAMIRAFTKQLFSDPSITRIQTDPAPGNLRAIRAYEKAGFYAVGEINTPDGPAWLMYCDRPEAE